MLESEAGWGRVLLLVTRYDVKVEWVVCPLLASVAAEAKALPPAMTEIASRTVPAIRCARRRAT